MKGKEIICHCHKITKDEILENIINNGKLDTEDIKEETTAATGCGICLIDIEEIAAENNEQHE